MPQVLNNLDEQRGAEVGLRQGKNASRMSQGMKVGGLATAVGMGGEVASRGAEVAVKGTSAVGKATQRAGEISETIGALRQAKNESKISDQAIDFAKTKLPPQAQAAIKAMDMAGVDTNKWIKRLIIGNIIFMTSFYLFIILGGVYMSLSLWDIFKVWWSGVWG